MADGQNSKQESPKKEITDGTSESQKQKKEEVLKEDKKKEVKFDKTAKKEKKKKKKSQPMPENVKKEIERKSLNLSTKQLEELWNTFEGLLDGRGSDEGIDLQHFKKGFELKDNDFALQFFKAMDKNNSGSVTFDELVEGISALHVDANKEEKMKFLERLYEIHEGNIDRAQFARLLKKDLKQNKINVKDHHINEVLDLIFEKDNTRNLRELMREYGITSNDLTLSISSSMKVFLERCKTEKTIKEGVEQEIAYEKKDKPKSKCSSLWEAVDKKLHRSWRHPATLYWIILYLGANVALFVTTFFEIKNHPAFELLEWSVVFSRSFASMLLFNSTMMLIFVSNPFITMLRRIPFLYTIIPFDYAIDAHKKVAWIIILCTLGHIGSHYRNFYVISNAPVTEVNRILNKEFTQTPSFRWLVFGDWAGITGHIMLLYFIIVYPFALLRRKGVQPVKKQRKEMQKSGSNLRKSGEVVVNMADLEVSPKETKSENKQPDSNPSENWMKRSMGGFSIRSSSSVPSANRVEHQNAKSEFEVPEWKRFLSWFNLFWFTHRLFVVYYACLLMHGIGEYLKGASFWKWFITPAVIYGVGWIVSRTKIKYSSQVEKAKILPSEVVMLQIQKPKDFAYRPGQYMYIKVPELAFFEYHPFSFTSAPHENFLQLNIDVRGAWTSKLHNLVLKTKDSRDIKVKIEGPYGAPAQHFSKYETVALFGAGIGVTPFASILKHLLHKVETKPNYTVKKVYFYWIARDHTHFEWFELLLTKLAEKNEIFKVHNYYTGAHSPQDMRSVLLQLASNVTYHAKSHCFVSGLRVKTHFGRPNTPQVIESLYSKHKNEKIGVFACGPPALTADLKQNCAKYENISFFKENF